MAAATARHQALVYLITYSRAELTKVPERENFAIIICEAFNQCTESTPVHWVVSREEHEAEGTNPLHYHMALRLDKRSRWSRVRQYIAAAYDIQVNFSCNHNTYYTAYNYVTKTDKEFKTSPNHPILTDPPATEQAVQAHRNKAKKGCRKRGRRRYSVYDVVEIVRKNKLFSRLELMNFAIKQQREGKTEMMEFIANRGAKAVQQAIDLGEEIEEVPAILERSNKTRLQLLQEAYNSKCVDDCGGKWLSMALQIISSNEISISSFCGAIYQALVKGRAKYNNIYLFGLANTGKTFILTPLKSVYKAFCNPATGTFAWVGVSEAEVIILNDFRWHPSIIPWGDLLQLLEGDTVHLPAPKTFWQKDIELSKDTPVFATADAPLVLIKGGNIDNANTQMMTVRWRFFNFWRQIPQEKQVSIPPCPCCFAKFVLDYKDLTEVM